MKKLFIYGLITPVLLVFTGITATFAIAQIGDHEFRTSIIIDASSEDVWNYMSDNENAHQWSVFFDHITTLKSNDPAIKEGGVGSVRRCFRNQDESGITWDEVTVKTDPYRFRQIHTYNIQNWPYEDYNALEFNVYQVYEAISENQTRLSLAADLKKPLGAYEKWMFYNSKWETHRIFLANLENIKAHIEQKEHYQRPHPWEEKNTVEKLFEAI